MSFSSIGDMRQHFQLTQTSSRLKSQLDTLVQEMTTGQKEDLTQHLGPQQTVVTGLDRQLSLLDSYANANKGTAQTLAAMQTVLGTLEDQRLASGEAMLAINEASTPSQLEEAGRVARLGFEATFAALNTRWGDQSLFAGNAVSGQALADAGDMITQIKAAILGATTAADVSTAVDTWFNAPGGGFETNAYQGDAMGFVTRPAGQSDDISINMRADDPMVRDLLKALAKGALAGDPTMGLTQSVSQDLQKLAGVDLLTVASDLAGVQSRLGHLEGQVQDAAVRIASQQTSFGMARNDMVSADPFETATRLDALQVQLETHYTLTARLSRLSLTEYLR